MDGLYKRKPIVTKTRYTEKSEILETYTNDRGFTIVKWSHRQQPYTIWRKNTVEKFCNEAEINHFAGTREMNVREPTKFTPASINSPTLYYNNERSNHD